MMFAKLTFVLACVALASAQTATLAGQTVPIGGVTYQLVPVGGLATQGVVGLTSAQLAAPAAAQYFTIAGAAPVATAAVAPATASLQVIRQPAPQIQFISAPAPAPQTISIAAAPAPRPVVVSAPAPAPRPVVIQTPPAPQPVVSVQAPPAPRPVVVSAPAPRPAAVRLSAPAPAVEDDYYEPGTPVAPYNFAFDETDEYGMNLKRNEVSENGIITGSYSFTTPEGYTRVVNYVSDEKGFRAQVQTNEPGTLTSAPADAEYQSSAPAPARR